MTKKRIILWTAPRCISTAFERAIIELEGVKVLHEPYASAYYLGPDKVSARYAKDPVDESAPTYEQVIKFLLANYDGKEALFSKDMAYCLNGRYEELLTPEFKDVTHSFLIRNPQKTIDSLYKASLDTESTGWDYFDKTDCGFVELQKLFSFVKEKTGKAPVVVDADDLLDDPEAMMEAYCAAVGLKYKEGMTKWEPGVVEEWTVWPGWHDDAINSSGIRKRVKGAKKNHVEEERAPELPKEVQAAIDESMPHYLQLREARICLPTTLEQ